MKRLIRVYAYIAAALLTLWGVAAAEGTAKANQALSNSISPNLLEWRRMDILEKWNGVMPQVAAGATPMIMIPKGGGDE